MKKSLLTSILSLATLLPMSAMAETTVNGMTPEAYFNQFIEAPVGSCADPRNLMFWMMSTEQVHIANTADGHDILAEIDVFLHADHTFVARYTESEVFKYYGDGMSLTKETKKEFSGNWSVNGTELDIGDIATAEALTYNGMTSVAMKYNNNNLSPGLGGRVVVGHHSLANYGEKTIAQYCNLTQ